MSSDGFGRDGRNEKFNQSNKGDAKKSTLNSRKSVSVDF